MKVCRHCKIEKNLDSFYKKYKDKEWRINLCKECQSNYYSERHKKYKKNHINAKNWNAYIIKHKNGYFLKSCKKHGNLHYDQIGLHQKLDKGDRNPTLYCIDCRKEGRIKTYNDQIKLERVSTGNDLICNTCKETKPIKSFTDSELKNKYCICRNCRLKMDKKYDKNVSMMKGFKFTSIQYEQMLKQQNGVCAICKLPEKQIRHGKIIKLSVDHCHKSEFKDYRAVRGLLCTNCNKGLGCLQESALNLRSAANYIDNYENS